MSTILVGYTPDEFGKAAVRHAAAEARLRGYGLLVVNGSKGDAYVDKRYAAPEVLEHVGDDLDGISYEVRQVVASDVADELLRVAGEEGVRLIVLGMRHRTPVGKLLMGSVAQRVILGAVCPVLTVKPDTEPV
ncbi:universal stress protein [Nocardioides lianchengensis]|uniref:Universal stress protein family protein n=1 Tax=Nocardioides lianchengensis TaxID=1045774 RepID=A0A1G6YQP6_9ACTN|nr:universal stress protein [Nocardioides lianchengensis]NYG09563.1 nucleotide-binding universal stress UspA family protein [Nocardioides lianchengensis]SDD92640.1 Universal stress protein family protein [Nocardioides lianchengensis]